MTSFKEQIQGLIDMVKQSFEAVPAPAPAAPPATPPASPVTMNKYMLADGTEIEVEELEVGKPVMVGGSPAPEGKHTLQDGTVISVDAAGLITEVVAPAAAPAQMNTHTEMQAALQKFAETATPDLQKMTTILKAVFENVFSWQLREEQEKATREAAITAYKTGFSSQKDELKAISEKLEASEKRNKQLFELVEKLAEASITTPAAATPAAFNSQKFEASTIVSQLKTLK